MAQNEYNAFISKLFNTSYQNENPFKPNNVGNINNTSILSNNYSTTDKAKKKFKPNLLASQKLKDAKTIRSSDNSRSSNPSNPSSGLRPDLQANQTPFNKNISNPFLNNPPTQRKYSYDIFCANVLNRRNVLYSTE